MKFVLTLIVIGLLTFFSYYFFIAEEFKGSPKTQVKQALGIKEKADPAIEMEVNEIAIKFGLTTDEAGTISRQWIRMEIESRNHKITNILNNKKLTEQQKSEKITKIQKESCRKIASYCGILDHEGIKKFEQWLASKDKNNIDSNNP